MTNDARALTPAHLEKITDAGTTDGRSAAGWVFDGNTSIETYREYRRLSDDGDPELYERWDSGNPLSGEWADGPTVRTLLEDHTDLMSGEDVLTDADDETIRDNEDAVHQAYENAHCDAFYAELDRIVAFHLAGDDE